MQTQTQTQQPLDILQQFDVLLKNHSIVVTDRENLAMLFEKIVDLCTQMPKAKLKAALKAATKPVAKLDAATKPVAKPVAVAKPRAKAQPKPKTKTIQPMIGPDGAADAPVISDLVADPAVRGRGRGRPRKATELVTASIANPNAETAEKKRRGRPKKDKTVTFSSNDDEDALIEKMMADVACMQKAAAADAAEVDDEETEDELESPMQIFTGKLMRCEEMSPAAAAAANTPESLSPIVQSSSSRSFGQFVEALEVEAPEVEALEVEAPEVEAPEVEAPEVEVEAPKTVVRAAKAAKAPKTVKAPKEPKTVKAPKEPKTAVKAPKEPKAPKAVNAKEVEVAVAVAEVAVVEVAALATENKETNGKIYLLDRVPTDSFSFNGKTYLRTETDNVYDNLTHELIGVWDHANHEIIAAFDDDELYYSDVE